MKRWTSLLIILMCASLTFAQDETQNPTELSVAGEFFAIDSPDNNTGGICLVWEKLPREEGIEYVIYEATEQNSDSITTAIAVIASDDKNSLMSEKGEYFGPWDKNNKYRFYEIMLERDTETKKYPEKYYTIGIRESGTKVMGTLYPDFVTATPKKGLIKWSKLNNFIILALLYLFVFYYIEKAKRNPNIFLRKIAGLEAVDEAIGRATEMGKPILYSTGYYDASEISTIASINILGQVAKKVANYDSRLIVPCKWPVAMTVCQEVVREAYLNEGRPDAYNGDDIFFIAGEQFSYTAAVNGMMVREKPAANFFLGTFAAESLLLAETGNMVGAIQIAGTDSVYQIPFFIAACDYCLIGEELYAASAYLSRDPKLVGTLKGQDIGKILIVICIVIGTLLVTLNACLPNGGFEFLNYIKYFFTVY